MATVELRKIRIWVIILAFINLVIVTSHYAEQKYWDNWRNYNVYNVTGTSSSIIFKREKFLLWQDWALIVSSSVLFLSYIYAYKVVTTRLHKYLRALLMVVPTVLVLFVGIQYVHLVLKLEFPTNHGPPTPFACSYLSGLEQAYCGVVEATYFFAILTGLFALMEIYLTIRNGPMQPMENHSQGSNGGYSADATGEIVGPPEHSILPFHNPSTDTHHHQLLSSLQFSPLAFSDQLMLVSSPEQGKATLNTPGQQEQTPIIMSKDPSTTPVQPSRLQQQEQQHPAEQIYDTRVPLPNPYSVQAQPYENHESRTQYQPPPPMPEQIYDNRLPLANPYSIQASAGPPQTGIQQDYDQRMPLPNPYSVQAQPYEYYVPRTQYQPPPPPLPEQIYDNRMPLANPYSIQASAGPPQTGIQQEYDQRMPLPNPYSVQAQPYENYVPRTQYQPPPPPMPEQIYDNRLPLANPYSIQASAGPPQAMIRQEYDQRPPANISFAATAPYPPTRTQQDEYDRRPPANTSVAATAPYPPTRTQQDEYDRRPPANISFAATAPYPPTRTQQDEYDRRPPANTSVAATAPYPPTST